METGIYVRVSTEEQAFNGFSIRAQIDKLKMYCSIKDWKVIDIYSDEGKSGKNIKERKELLRLIEDVKKNKIKNILVYKIDRLTRSTRDLIDLIDFFNNNDCSFNSLTENIDTKSSTGRMFIKIIGIFAEFERENIVERVKLGLERKVREGYTIASKNISFGYNKEIGKRIQIINQYEAYVVRKIYYMFINGESYTNISKYLNKFNIRTKTGKKWTSKTIKLILSNKNYIGFVRYGINSNKYFEVFGKHEPIIEKKTFEIVQQKMIKKTNVYDNIICKCGKKLRKKKINYASSKKKKIETRYKFYCTNCKINISIKKLDRLIGDEIDNWQNMNYKEKLDIMSRKKEIIVNIE